MRRKDSIGAIRLYPPPIRSHYDSGSDYATACYMVDYHRAYYDASSIIMRFALRMFGHLTNKRVSKR